MNKINPKKYKTPQGYLEYSKFAELMTKYGFNFLPQVQSRDSYRAIDFSKTRIPTYQEINIANKLYFDIVIAFNSTFEYDYDFNAYFSDEDKIKVGVFEDIIYTVFQKCMEKQSLGFKPFKNSEANNMAKIFTFKKDVEKIANTIYDDWERFSVQCNTSYSWTCFDSSVFVGELIDELLTCPAIVDIFAGSVKYKDSLEKEFNIHYLVQSAKYGTGDYATGINLKKSINRIDLCPVFAVDESLINAITKTNPSKGAFSIVPFAKNGVIFYPENNKIKGFDFDSYSSILFTLFAVDNNYIHGLHCTKNCLTSLIHFKVFSYPLCIDVKKTEKITDWSGGAAIASYFHKFDDLLSVHVPKLYSSDIYPWVTDIYEVNTMSHAINKEGLLDDSTGIMYKGQWLLYQIFLYKMIKNEQPSSYECRQAGVIKGKSDKISRSKTGLSPIVIGKDYKPKYKYGQPIGTHASPQTHWRSGHWRQQPIGKKDKPEYKTIWIEPTLINA